MTVRTDANLNYPFVLSRGAVVIGHVQIAKWPEWSQNKVELTGHDSAGDEESMPDGIRRPTPFVGTMVSTTDNIEVFRDDFEAGTVTTWTIADDVDSCSFSGWIMSMKRNDADGAKPDAVKWEISIQPTGPLTWVPS